MTKATILVAAVLAAAVASQPIDCSFKSIYPKQYIAYRSSHPMVIDGRLDDPEWQEVAFTDRFVDISTQTRPKFDTFAKIRYDDNFLYIGGHIQDTAVWANITSTCHCINSTQDQVIYHDNDFEIFVDPSGSTHYYKEFEMNAANQTWDLLLNKPYDDGGYENSSRVYGPAGFDMQPPLYCKSYVSGQLNNPNANNQYWSVEVALPFSKLAYNSSVSYPPKSGDIWRINFSRVEWAVKVVDGMYQKYPSCQSCPTPGAAVEDNWVWSPQGSIAMHLPEKWGMLQFSDDAVNTTQPIYNPQWTVRSVAMYLYYAQHAYASANDGRYTANVTELYAYAPAHTLDGTCTDAPTIQLQGGGSNFVAQISSLTGDMTASITDDRYLTVSTA